MSEASRDREDVRRAFEFEQLVVDVSAQVVSAPDAEFADAVVEAVGRVVRFFGADRGGLLNVSDDRRAIRVVLAWYSDPLHQRVPGDVNLVELFPYGAKLLLEEAQPFIVENYADAPAEAARDRATHEAMGVRSTLNLPIVVDDAVRYIVTIDAMRREVRWPASYVPRLRLLGEIIASTFERHRVSEALRASEARLSLAARSAGAGLWEVDVETGGIWATPEARALYGFAPDAALTLEAVLGSLHPDDAGRVRARVAAVARSGGEFVDEYRVLRPDGTIRWLAARGAKAPAGNGSPARIMGVSVDVTEPKRREVERQASEARLHAAIDVASLGFYVVTDGQFVSHLDERCQNLFGIPADQAGGAEAVAFWMMHLHPDDAGRLTDHHHRLNSGAEDRVAVDYRYQHPERGTLWLHQITKVLDRQPGGFAKTTLGVVRDVTEESQAREALTRANAELLHLRELLERENAYLRQEAGVLRSPAAVIAQSDAMRRAMKEVEMVAATDSTVLLLGETGTGKELLASAIHGLSPRRHRAMVRVNCAAIPVALIEAELFGREKGAYTGALSKQVGRFELASGSTIFLDEIGDLPIDIQVKLLRVLQERQIERLGNPRPVDVDLRVIAATNRDLHKEVREGRFREDLFYRLNVFPLRVPALRERLDDLPLLVDSIVDEVAGRMGKRFEPVSRSTIESLRRYHWPGNVRELRNCIERALILASGVVLTVEVPRAGALTDAPPREDAGAKTDRDELIRVLEHCGWRIRGSRGAAERLGLKPTTVEYRMARLGIKRP